MWKYRISEWVEVSGMEISSAPKISPQVEKLAFLGPKANSKMKFLHLKPQKEPTEDWSSEGTYIEIFSTKNIFFPRKKILSIFFFFYFNLSPYLCLTVAPGIHLEIVFP